MTSSGQYNNYDEGSKCGALIQGKEGQLIRSVVQVCDEEAMKKTLLIPLTKATAEAAKYCSVGKKNNNYMNRYEMLFLQE